MFETQNARMKRLAVKLCYVLRCNVTDMCPAAAGRAAPIYGVANNSVPDVRHVDAYLMRAPGFQPALHKRCRAGRVSGFRLIIGARRFSATR